jgi:hypothetical protein
MNALTPCIHRRIALALAVGAAQCATEAAASYAQMTLPGLWADILFVVIAAYALVVDVVLLCKGFRSRVSVIISTLITLALVLGLVSAREEVAATFNTLPEHWEVKLLEVSIVVVPLILLAAPVAQHLELRRQRPRRAVHAAIAVQAVLVGIGWTLAYLDQHPLPSTIAERQELRNLGEHVEPGGVAALRDTFEKRHSWGTDESRELLKGVESSALIHGAAPLPPEDRKALTALLERDRAAARPRRVVFHHYGYIETKLLWDTLEPGNVQRMMPRGKSFYYVDQLLEFIDRHGPQRLCSVDDLAETDRAALTRALTTGFKPEVVAKAKHSLDRLAEACRAARAGA